MPGKGKGGVGGGVGRGMSSMLNAAGKRIREVDVQEATEPPAVRKPKKPRTPAKRWATPMGQRRAQGLRTVETVPPRPASDPTLMPDAKWSPHEVTATNWDRQTPKWVARHLPGLRVPKAFGGGPVPTDVPAQAAFVANRRAALVTYPRRKFPPAMREQVFNATKDRHDQAFPHDSTVGDPDTTRDVAGVLIHRHKPWDVGHPSGQEHHVQVHDATVNGVHPDDFKDAYLNPGPYRAEDPSTNRSHRYEGS